MSAAGRSVSFDRAADYYDRTRRLPPQVAAAQTELLRGVLGEPAGPVLEVGVGTGRIAVPLAAAGFTVVGLDLSGAMLERLVGKASTVRPVRADATRLPFRPGRFAAVVVSHVLHLVADWRAAVAEMLRVTRPGGVLLATRGRGEAGLAADLQQRIARAAGVERLTVGLDDLADLDGLLATRGVTVEQLTPIPNSTGRTVADFLQRIAENCYSWTWPMTEERRLAAVAEVTDWVRQNLGEPGTVRLAARPVRWRAYRLPSAGTDQPSRATR